MVAKVKTHTYPTQLFLNKDWDYSNTTRKHLYLFMQEHCYSIYGQLGSNKRQSIIKLINDGIIKIDETLD